jgi:hypothetical protein
MLTSVARMLKAVAHQKRIGGTGTHRKNGESECVLPPPPQKNATTMVWARERTILTKRPPRMCTLIYCTFIQKCNSGILFVDVLRSLKISCKMFLISRNKISGIPALYFIFCKCAYTKYDLVIAVIRSISSGMYCYAVHQSGGNALHSP